MRESRDEARGSATRGRLDAEWESHRPVVFGVAYRLLGEVGAAEDAVQDVWLRAARADLSGVRDLRAWLVRVTGRRCLDLLGSARRRYEVYPGPWLPEPLPTGADAAQPVLVEESVTTAALIVMAELKPDERVAFVLHDVFDVPHAEIAEMLRVSPAACRQLASRARRRVRAATAPPEPSRGERERVLAAFRAAYRDGDLDALVRLLHPDVVYTTDGGGQVFAARIPIVGATRVGGTMLRVARRRGPALLLPFEVNGEIGALCYWRGELASVDTFGWEGDRIAAIRRVLNPHKLSHLGWLRRLPGDPG
ncbi:RNA polymerase sigma factor SigJ [Thermobifida halotolerans]|uniref:RNA polymerase sigma factor SigJ n=1 Tax=Thermobifida halotolerans TaxID=483545 RepID=A0AA97M1W7_9ACTN|nr:RNA polymerase sigma factor SigJ [Thermobifida halotolerans]